MQDDQLGYFVMTYYRCPKDHCEGHLKDWHFPRLDDARQFRSRGLASRRGWAPNDAIDIEIGDIRGRDVIDRQPSREVWLEGLEGVRRAMAGAHGPLMADVGPVLNPRYTIAPEGPLSSLDDLF